LSLSYGGLSLGGVSLETQELNENDVARIANIPNSGNIAAIGPMVLGVAEINNNKVMIAGVDFGVSAILKPWWEIGEALPGANEVVLGSTAAEILGVAKGAIIKLDKREMKVNKVLSQTGSQDDHIVFTSTKTAQEILNKPGVVSLLEVAALCVDCPIGDIIDQISGALPNAEVMAIKQVVEGRMNAMNSFQNFLYGISMIVVLVGCLVVFVTMMGSVRERTTEIGIFRAIGFRRGHIMHIVLFEAAILSMLAGVLGYAVGIGASAIALPFFSEGQDAAVHLDPMLALGAFVFSLVLGVVASYYPAMVASKLDPNEALRAL
jgi:putative ABC transport system permease protein